MTYASESAESGTRLAGRLLLFITATTLAACASSNRESDTTVAQVADLAAAKGRLESELATSKQRTDRERTARIEAEVKLGMKTFELALEKHNAVVRSTLCDVNSGAISAQTAKERLDASEVSLKPFYSGCGKDEPGDRCVARKARAGAEGATP